MRETFFHNKAAFSKKYAVGICICLPPKIYYYREKIHWKINPCECTFSARISLLFVDVFYLLLILRGWSKIFFFENRQWAKNSKFTTVISRNILGMTTGEKPGNQMKKLTFWHYHCALGHENWPQFHTGAHAHSHCSTTSFRPSKHTVSKAPWWNSKKLL